MMQNLHIALQVYFTTYEKLKAQMKKREGMLSPYSTWCQQWAQVTAPATLLSSSSAPEGHICI